jgi:hypothetical protein
MTTILARRLSTLAEAHNLLAPEQGGFREGEEAISQFIALAEIIRRRRLRDNKKTYLAFIDFKKAFDKVMHEALFEKLDALGFRGQFLEVIKALYRSSKACVRVGEKTGPVYSLRRGTRQGCPLSPILFLIFVNDLLNHMPQGALVPGVKGKDNKCKALLFADDVVGICGDLEETRAFLRGIDTWSKLWHMPIGARKCGVMLVNGSEEEQEDLTNTTFTIGGEEIPIVQKYKYLGIWISDKFGDKDCTDEIAHCKVLAERIKQATDMRRAFLRDPKLPLELKLAVIRSKILSVGTYGGEWVGLCQARTDIVQKSLNTALKLALNSSTKSNLHSIRTMSMELMVPTIEQKMAEMRIRLWQKAETTKTWLGRLLQTHNRFVSKNKVWSTQTGWMVARMKDKHSGNGDHIGNDRQKTHIRGVAAYLYEDRTTIRTDNSRNDDQKREMKSVVISTITRALLGDMVRSGRQVRSTIDYVAFGYYRTRKFIKSAAYLPALSSGAVWLARLRTGAWWTTRQRLAVLKARGQQQLLEEDKCPCCKKSLSTTEPELVHILLSCTKWHKDRMSILGPYLRFLVTELDKGIGILKDRRLEVAIRLLGGYMRPEDPVPGYLKEENRSQGDTKALDLFAESWGGSEEVHLPGLNAHGYTVVARFLDIVMPKHRAFLFPETIGKEKATDPAIYETTTFEDTPVKGGVWLGTSVESDLDDGHEFGLTTRALTKSRDELGSIMPGIVIQANASRGMAAVAANVYKRSRPAWERNSQTGESDQEPSNDRPWI